ncbi:MAG TPA: LptF/LptG family permease [Verrucomicrobiae bacterium]|jgi:lipopolysaccharide export system permease protein|nr:LptF/LptG family permease [Verrucomicrobiae bacterium]
MRLLDRYLFRELLTPLVFCLVGIQSFIIFVTAFSDAGKIGEAKLGFGQTIGYSVAASMGQLTIVIPVSLLLALLMALTQHARHHELTAMRAAGISLWRICVPYFIVGLIATGVVFALNESVVPRSMDFADRTLSHHSPTTSHESAQNVAFTNEREHRKWVLPGYYHLGSSTVPHPWVQWVFPDGSARIFSANEAVRTNGVWVFYDVQEFSQADVLALPVPILQTNVLVVREFNETPEEIGREIKMSNYFSERNPNIPFKDISAYLQWHPNLSRQDRGRLETEMQERLAMPVTCLVVALIAIPFGATPGRRNLFFGVAGSIFICFVYFILQRVSFLFGSSGAWPAWLAAWLPNLVFGITGIFLMSRIR